MGTKRIYQGANFSASNLGRSERLISAGIVASASTTSGSNVLTNVTIATGTAAAGQTITGLGIPDGTTITNATTPGQLTISVNATATATGVTVQSTSRTGIVGEYLFGRDANTSKINLAGGPPLTFVGSPIFAPRSATLSQNNWADTSIYDSQELTMLIVCAVPTGTGAYFIGNYNNSNNTDTTTFELTSSLLSAITSANDNTQEAFTNVAARTPLTDYTIKAIRTTGAASFIAKIDEYRAGARMGGSSKTSTKTRKVTTSAAIAIGSARGSSGFAGTIQCAGAAIWSRALSDAEMVAEAAAITAKMAAWPQQAIVT